MVLYLLLLQVNLLLLYYPQHIRLVGHTQLARLDLNHEVAQSLLPASDMLLQLLLLLAANLN